MSDQRALLANLRTGFGFDIERFEEGRDLILGGTVIDYKAGLVGHADGDAVCHALLDALLSAAGLPEVDTIFPPDDPAWEDAGGFVLLSQAVSSLLRTRLDGIINVSIRIATHEPDLTDDVHRMQHLLGEALQIDPLSVGITFGDNCGFDAVGRGEALVAFASLLCLLKGRSGSARSTQGSGAATSTAKNKDDEEDDLSGLPERAQVFEKAVRSGIPPLPPAPDPSDGDTLVVYTDGACRGNPGPSAAGIVVMDSMGRLVYETGIKLGKMTNNQAEYDALQAAVDWITETHGTSLVLDLRLDSELIVKQLTGVYKVKDSELKVKSLKVMGKLLEFNSFSFTHVPRKENERADKLANLALDGKI